MVGFPASGMCLMAGNAAGVYCRNVVTGTQHRAGETSDAIPAAAAPTGVPGS